jgi:archaemetzincin
MLTLMACNTNDPYFSTQKPPAKILAIQPFIGIDSMYVQTVKTSLETYYQFQVKILAPIALPNHTTNQAVAQVMHMELPIRYRADSLLTHLRNHIPKDCDYILGITHQDITCTNRDKNGQIQFPAWMHADWGIFGLGSCPGKPCIVSVFRLNFDGKGTETLKDRLSKVAKHEIGHNLGLPHCRNKNCFMRQVNLQNALQSLDEEPHTLCKACRKKINLLPPKSPQKFAQKETRPQ